MSQESSQTPLPPRNNVIHNAAIAGAIITPLVMLLPPRRMDVRFFFLAGTFSISTNQLMYEYTGQSIYSRFNSRASSAVSGVFESHLPDKAKETQRLLREQRERDAAATGIRLKDQRQQDVGVAKVAKDVWMGGESEGWKEKRAEEHRRGMEDGKGLSDIIIEQIKDVVSESWRRPHKEHDTGESPRGGAESSEKKS